MTLQSEFIPLTIEGLPALAAEKKAEGARFVQMLCVNTEEGIEMCIRDSISNSIDDSPQRARSNGSTPEIHPLLPPD